MLILINDDLIIDDSEIRKASRNGNYTDIFTKKDEIIQQWDEDEILWNQLKKACFPLLTLEIK